MRRLLLASLLVTYFMYLPFVAACWPSLGAPVSDTVSLGRRCCAGRPIGTRPFHHGYRAGDGY